MSARRLLWMVVCSMVWASAAAATVLVPADLGALSREARTIARGRVAAVDAQWTDGRRTVETVVTLDVESYLKGSLGSTLSFRVPGGRLGRFRSVVVGAPGFEVGQRVVVFLGYQTPGVPYVLGLSQGVYRLVPASVGPGWDVTPPAVVATVHSSTPQPIVRGDPNRRPLELAVFERQVRSFAGRTQ